MDHPRMNILEYCDEECDDIPLIRAAPDIPLGMSYLPTLPGVDFDFEKHTGISHTREGILKAIEEIDMKRPILNIVRKNRENATNEKANNDYFVARNGETIDRLYFSPI